MLNSDAKVKTSREHKRAWYYKQIAAGLCTVCGKPLDSEGKNVRCATCLEKRRKKAAEAYWVCKETGACTKCGESILGGTETLCVTCQHLATGYQKTKKLKRIEEGRCRTCGLPKQMGEEGKDCFNCSAGTFKFRWI